MEDVKARYDDNHLYLLYARKKGFDTSVSMEDFLNSHRYPSFETIRRARAKVQMKNPELKPDDIRQMRRNMREAEYREWALN